MENNENDIIEEVNNSEFGEEFHERDSLSENNIVKEVKDSF